MKKNRIRLWQLLGLAAVFLTAKLVARRRRTARTAPELAPGEYVRQRRQALEPKQEDKT